MKTSLLFLVVAVYCVIALISPISAEPNTFDYIERSHPYILRANQFGDDGYRAVYLKDDNNRGWGDLSPSYGR